MSKRSPEVNPEQRPLVGYGPGSYGPTERAIDYDEEPKPVGEKLRPNIKPKMQDVFPYDAIDTALLAQLPKEVLGVTDGRRLEFLRMHPDWVPYKESELTASIGVDRFENPPLVTYLLGAKAKNREAVKKVVRQVTAIRVDATRKIHELEKAYDPDGNFLASVVKEDDFVRIALTEYIYAVNELNLFDWPDPFLRRHKSVMRNTKVERQKMAISAALLKRTDEELSALTVSALSSEYNRAKFWENQEELASKHPDTEMLIIAARSSV